MDSIRTIQEALPYIPADDYGTWVNVGMALKHEGLPLETWRTWSETSQKSKAVKAEEWAKKWDSFKSETENPVTGGTIIAMAKNTDMTLKQLMSQFLLTIGLLKRMYAKPVSWILSWILMYQGQKAAFLGLNSRNPGNGTLCMIWLLFG